MVKPLLWYLFFTCFKLEIISVFPLMLHAFNDPKSIFPDFVCRKGIPPTKKKFIAISTLWWCLAMGGGKGILWIVLWWSGLLRMALSCIMCICGPYIDSSRLMSSIGIVQFLIWFISSASLSTCVDVHITSCSSIIAASAPYILRLWNYALLPCTAPKKNNQ